MHYQMISRAEGSSYSFARLRVGEHALRRIIPDAHIAGDGNHQLAVAQFLEFSGMRVLPLLNLLLDSSELRPNVLSFSRRYLDCPSLQDFLSGARKTAPYPQNHSPLLQSRPCDLRFEDGFDRELAKEVLEMCDSQKLP